jgi:demethylmenaquinone methyltransferase/2-methoxy-6-polyprenyl-1,4-benzoquinol methylase
MPERRAPGNPVPAAEVRAMFDRIAPIYDRMNTVMTAGLDAGWRRAAARATRLRPGMRALDVACGSGTLTRELARAVGPTGSALGVDLSDGMLELARRRAVPAGSAIPEYRQGDALALPVEDGVYDAATIAFGLRNVGDYRRALAEMTRAVMRDGRVVVLEIATPRSAVGRAVAGTWFRRIVPLVGRLAGGGAAYGYLPRSVERYPRPEAIAALMAEVGLLDVGWRRLALGMVTVHEGRRG